MEYWSNGLMNIQFAAIQYSINPLIHGDNNQSSSI